RDDDRFVEQVMVAVRAQMLIQVFCAVKVTFVDPTGGTGSPGYKPRIADKVPTVPLHPAVFEIGSPDADVVRQLGGAHEKLQVVYRAVDLLVCLPAQLGQFGISFHSSVSFIRWRSR